MQIVQAGSPLCLHVQTRAHALTRMCTSWESAQRWHTRAGRWACAAGSARAHRHTAKQTARRSCGEGPGGCIHAEQGHHRHLLVRICAQAGRGRSAGATRPSVVTYRVDTCRHSSDRQLDSISLGDPNAKASKTRRAEVAAVYTGIGPDLPPDEAERNCGRGCEEERRKWRRNPPSGAMLAVAFVRVCDCACACLCRVRVRVRACACACAYVWRCVCAWKGGKGGKGWGESKCTG